MMHFEKPFAQELSYYDEKGKTPIQQWVSFLEDLANYADYYWDIPKMQYDLVKSKAEWQEFLSHPDRQPYQIAVVEWRSYPLSQVYERVLEAIKESIALLDNKTISEDTKRALLRPLESIVKGIVHSRYELYEMEITDDYVAITQKDRDLAHIELTPVQQARFTYITDVIALQQSKSVDEIREKLLVACERNPARLGEFFATCQFDDELKELYKLYRDIAASNKTFSDLNVILGFKIWRELYEHGVDLERYMKFLDYPSVREVEKKLTNFLSNTEINDEIVKHFKDEFPISYKKYKKQGYINLIDVSQEEAKTHNYPTRLRTEKETIAMVQEYRSVMSAYFPISKEESSRYIMFSPTHPFAVQRAYQSRTYNSEKLPVNMVVTTPLVDSRDDYLRTLAHETTHAIHQMILNRGAEYHVLAKSQADQVPTGVLEDFSQLVEGQFSEETNDGAPPKKYKGSLFTSFNQALGSRWQAPFGLVQLQVRERFEEWIKKGITVVTQEMLEELHAEFNPKMRAWWETGVAFRRPGLDALSWFSALAPYDGLVYMKRFISRESAAEPQTKQKQTHQLSMAEAFTKRFGQNWIKDPDARALLYWLLLETGRNHETEKFGELILKKDIRECLEELQKIGIDASEFRPVD